MSGKLCKNSPVKTILVFSLSNVGDVVLTASIIDILLQDFPGAKVTAIVGPKAASLFAGHPRIDVNVFDKHASWPQQWRWLQGLRRQRFDVLLDLRQTALGLFVPARFCTPFIPQSCAEHLRFKHLRRLQTVYPQADFARRRAAIVPKPVAAAAHLSDYAVIAPGAADSVKRWHTKGFAAVADALMSQGQRIVFVGAKHDAGIIQEIEQYMTLRPVSLIGQTDLRELAFVLQKANWVMTHDSGTMHLSSYLDVPTVALWGPTPVDVARPWSSKSAVVYRGNQMSMIQVEDVLNGVREIR